MSGGVARAAVFGVSDGLVSNSSLILGVAGAGSDAAAVRLAGIAGLIAGAVSMAAGEWVSMQAQRELFEHELDVERSALARRPQGETAELTHLYESRGIDPALARQMSEEVMRDPELALETHAREELGIDPQELGSPGGAAAGSFASFFAGGLLPLLPWFVVAGSVAVWSSVLLALLGAAGVGILLARSTGRPWPRVAARQVLIAMVAAGATYGIGSLVGVSVS